MTRFLQLAGTCALALLFLFPLHAQEYTYFQTITPGHVWIYVYNQGADQPAPAGGYAISVGADTTINGRTYRRLLRAELAGTQDCPPEERPCFELETPYRRTDSLTRTVAFMRDDPATRRVYRYNTSPTDELPAEYAVLDFGLAAGDTLPEPLRSFVCPGFDDVDSCGVVTEIDGDLSLTNTAVIRVNLTGSDTRVGLPAFGEISYSVIRGFQNLGIFPDGPDQLVDFCNLSPEECAQLLSNRPTLAAAEFTLYPNPTRGAVNVSAPAPVAQLYFYDAAGRRLESLVGQPAGLYTAVVVLEDGRRGVGRVVVW